MEKWILKNEVDYLANINSYGKNFFDNQDYLRNIESALNISFDQKKISLIIFILFRRNCVPKVYF